MSVWYEVEIFPWSSCCKDLGRSSWADWLGFQFFVYCYATDSAASVSLPLPTTACVTVLSYQDWVFQDSKLFLRVCGIQRELPGSRAVLQRLFCCLLQLVLLSRSLANSDIAHLLQRWVNFERPSYLLSHYSGCRCCWHPHFKSVLAWGSVVPQHSSYCQRLLPPRAVPRFRRFYSWFYSELHLILDFCQFQQETIIKIKTFRKLWDLYQITTYHSFHGY